MADNPVKRISAFVLALSIIVLPFFAFAAGGLVPCDGTGDSKCTFSSFVLLLNNIIDFLITAVALPVSAILFAWAGFLYLTAAGNGSQISKAHGIFKNVFVGLILTLAAWLIINLVTMTLAGKGINQLLGQ